MQSNKTSKKTRQKSDEAVTAAPETSVAENTPLKSRNSRSSTTKKSEPAEAGTVKHHHKAVSSIVVETPIVVSDAPPLSTVPARKASPEQIAELAHSYWVARGHAHGSAEEDWLRAEQELTGIR